jgi:halimadienyl-diphosphate synthase
MMQAIRNLLQKLDEQPNQMSPSAYDTAWLAWLYPACRQWVLARQNPDGSWGSSSLEYFHDRTICTLSAVNALAATSTQSFALDQMERGIAYLEAAIPRLSEDVSDLVGFELLLPALVQIGKNLGLKYDRVEHLIQPYMKLYHQKLSLIPQEVLYSAETSVGFSLEFLGFAGLDKNRALSLLSDSHGIHSSPAVTAFVKIATQNSQADTYLQHICRRYDWQVPPVTPFETFELIWSLYPLSLALDLQTLSAHLGPLGDSLEQALTPRGVGSTKGAPPDADDTSLALLLLHRMGRATDPVVLESFETSDHFQCYAFERNISLDIHIHLLETLKTLPDFARRESMLNKALSVLRRHLTGEYVVDKWHISPYYSTAHAIIALTGLDDALARPYVHWLLKTQGEDGRWTFYPHCPEAAREETAHALLALMTVYDHHRDVPRQCIERGIRYLRSGHHQRNEIPNLWITKVLYCPYSIREATILSALAKYEVLR